MLHEDDVPLRSFFLLVYSPFGSGSTTILSLPNRMYSSTLRKEQKYSSKRRIQQLASDEGKMKYKASSHLFTSSALILRYFARSSLHFNQNFSSSFFNSKGFQPHREAPGISFSNKNATRPMMSLRMQPCLLCYGPTGLALMLVTIPPELSAIMKVVY